MGPLGFTSADLANLKAALVSGALRVKIGDREIEYRSQKELIAAIEMVQSELNGAPSDTVVIVQSKFSKGIGSGSL